MVVPETWISPYTAKLSINKMTKARTVGVHLVQLVHAGGFMFPNKIQVISISLFVLSFVYFTIKSHISFSFSSNSLILGWKAKCLCIRSIRRTSRHKIYSDSVVCRYLHRKQNLLISKLFYGLCVMIQVRNISSILILRDHIPCEEIGESLFIWYPSSIFHSSKIVNLLDIFVIPKFWKFFLLMPLSSIPFLNDLLYFSEAFSYFSISLLSSFVLRWWTSIFETF